MSSKVIQALSAVILAAAASPITAFAQRAPAGRVGVTVALARDYPFGDTPAVILRRGVGDIIVLPDTSANAEDLVSAVLTMQVFMDSEGDKASRDQTLLVERLASVPAHEAATATKVLAGIRESVPKRIAGVGVARSGVIYVPNSTTRAREKARGKLAIYPKSTP